MGRSDTRPRGQQSTYMQETYNIPANDVYPLSLTFDYLLIESVVNAAGTVLNSIPARIDGNIRTDLPVGMKLRFNKDQGELLLINETASQLNVVVGVGVGDVDDYRFFQNAGFVVEQDWGAAFTTVMQETDQTVSGGTKYAKETQLTPSGSTATDTIEAATGRRRLISAKLKETSGTPDAMVVITMDDTSTNGDDWVFVCYAGEVATLPYPILMNDSASAGELHVQWLNGATGHAWLSYENGTVTPSGAI